MVTREHLHVRADAVAAQVGVLRRATREWLAGVLDDADAVDDLTLAVSEALENAADHAFVASRSLGTMSIRAHVRPERDELVITVSDDGSWRSPRTSPRSEAGLAVRGRGLALMRRMAESSVTAGPEGTVVTLTHPLGAPAAPETDHSSPPPGAPRGPARRGRLRSPRTPTGGSSTGRAGEGAAEGGPVQQIVHEVSGPLSVLLVEDDDADALLVTEHFADAERSDGLTVHLRRACTVAEAEEAADEVDCVLLDLALPDAQGFDALERVLRTEGPAVVVLTGRHDERLGVQAVSAGAQDYLLKDTVDGAVLLRAVRYAVERIRWERVQRQLWDAQIRAEENVRLERGLLPTPLLTDTGVRVVARYEPGAGRSLLGGDFYDAVEDDDGTLHVVIGDVCGHGPDEAALGVNLRIAWRTMVLGGIETDRLLPTVGRLLAHERDRIGVFATLASLTVDRDRRHAQLRLAGHPPPVLLRDGDQPTSALPTENNGRPIGILPDDRWEPIDVTLPERWAMLLYTDGLIEGRPHADAEGPPGAADDEGVLGVTGLLAVLDGTDTVTDTARGPAGAGRTAWHADPDGMLDGVMSRVRQRTHGRTDDVAAVLLVREP